MIQTKALKQEGQCHNCKYAELGVTGPSPSDLNDGVNCRNRKLAEYDDENIGGAYMVEEFDEYGCVNLFRIEAIDPDGECPCWGTKAMSGHELGIFFVKSSNELYEQAKQLRDDGVDIFRGKFGSRFAFPNIFKQGKANKVLERSNALLKIGYSLRKF